MDHPSSPLNEAREPLHSRTLRQDEVPRACPVCGSAGWQPAYRKREMTLDRCGGCGFIGVPSIHTSFASGSHYDAAGEYYLSPDKLASDLSTVRYQREVRFFRRHCLSGTVLDVGCGTGGFLKSLERAHPSDYGTLGYEVSSPAAAFAQESGLRVFSGPWDQIDIPKDSLDAVTFWAVLEHLPNPGEIYRTALERVRAGGVVIALVPNWGSLARRVLGTKYRYILPEHLNYFDIRSLSRLVQSSPQARLVEITTCHFNPVVILQDLRGDGRFVEAHQRARLLATTTRLKTRSGLSLVRSIYQRVESMLGSLHLADNLVVAVRKV